MSYATPTTVPACDGRAPRSKSFANDIVDPEADARSCGASLQLYLYQATYEHLSARAVQSCCCSSYGPIFSSDRTAFPFAHSRCDTRYPSGWDTEVFPCESHSGQTSAENKPLRTYEDNTILSRDALVCGLADRSCGPVVVEW